MKCWYCGSDAIDGSMVCCTCRRLLRPHEVSKFERMRKIYDVIRQEPITDRGIRMKLLHLVSKSTLSKYLNEMERKGLIRRGGMYWICVD